uniref:Uncharacterized protein n=1 Tax=Megaselia scalaris TaxID=36166 RepID=T1GCR3_MEGSC
MDFKTLFLVFAAIISAFSVTVEAQTLFAEGANNA